MYSDSEIKLEMCQYDTDAPVQSHPHPHAGILQIEVEKRAITLIVIKLDLYFPVISLCIKYESNTPIFFKNIERKTVFEGEKGP